MPVEKHTKGTALFPVVFVSIILIAGCKPTWRDYSKEQDRVYRAYLTGDVVVARAALLENEKIIAKHEARGTPMDVKAERCILYARLCAISSHMELTNDAAMYFQKFEALKRDTNATTMTELIGIIERSERETRPKWRQQK